MIKNITEMPTAMIWICDRDKAVVVVSIKRLDSDVEYLADISIRPRSWDECGRRILAEALPDSHARCRMAGKTAALMLAAYRAERRPLTEQLDLNVTHRVVLAPYMLGSTALIIDEDEWDAKYQWEADENGDCCVIDNTPVARSMLRGHGEAHVWSEVDGEGGATFIVAGIRRDAFAFYRTVVPRHASEEEDIVVWLDSTDDPGDGDGS